MDQGRRVNQQSLALAHEWRRLGRVATVVALLTSPALFVLLHSTYDWPLGWALVFTLLGVAAFRGLIDVLAHKLIPAPSLYGADGFHPSPAGPFLAALVVYERITGRDPRTLPAQAFGLSGEPQLWSPGRPGRS